MILFYLIKMSKLQNNYVLCPIGIKDIDIPFNIDILKKFVKLDIDSNLEYYNDINSNYNISNPKKAEWIIYKSIDGSELVGNGNTNIDVSYKNIGIDVGVLTLNGKKTNEKSIMQNFSCNNLDEKFVKDKCNEAVDFFKNNLINKYEKGKKYYYFLFICNKKNIYLSCLQLQQDKINNIETGMLTRSLKNISIKNFINEQHGIVNLYKSKKRLELRLTSDIIKNDCTIKLY
jgi:hypothetical protein